MSRRAMVAGGIAVALAVVAGGLAGHAAPAAVGAAIAIAAITALLVVRELAGRACAPVAKRTAVRDAAAGRLRDLDRAVSAVVASPSAFDRELRPLVLSIATTRLARRGVDARRSPEAAEAILGPELWRWIRGGGADLAPTRSRAATTAHLQALIDRLEGI